MNDTHCNVIEKEEWNRWLIPPAALAVHLCIGMAYGFSVFWIPLSQAIGISHSFVCSDLTFFSSLFTTTCDWAVRDLAYIFMFFFIFLGISAFFAGGWLEVVGPRKGAITAMIFWCGGLVIGAIGVQLHQLWLLWFGVGIIGGIGLGLGYISPVSMLIQWFPDKPGMAVGISIMGFGGGSIIGAPLANALMNYFRTPSDVGVWKTFFVIAFISSIYMSLGSYGYRLPSKQLKLNNSSSEKKTHSLEPKTYVHVQDAHYTVQFWMMCSIFFIFSASGVGITSVLSPMIQEMFGGTLMGYPEISFSQLNAEQKIMIGEIAAGFTGFLFLFNLLGRFFWPYLSDRIGRKNMCFGLFFFGTIFYACLPTVAHIGNQIFFTIMFCLIMSFYGGGIAMIPAYLSDIFGTKFLAAIHGRLVGVSVLSGIAGPFFVSFMRQFHLASGGLEHHSYDTVLYVIACAMVVGVIMNCFITPVNKKWLIPYPESKDPIKTGDQNVANIGSLRKRGSNILFVCAWLCVALPFFIGIWVTCSRSIPFFIQKPFAIEQKK